VGTPLGRSRDRRRKAGSYVKKRRSNSGSQQERTLPHDRKYQGKKSHPLPLWNGILDHCERIGPALWEFVWLLDKITREKDGKGIVLGGQPVTIDRIARELRRGDHTVRRNLDRLEAGKYIERTRTPYGLTIRVRNSRKFGIWSKKEIVTFGRSLSVSAEEIGHKRRRDRPKVTERSAINGRSNKDHVRNTANNPATNPGGAVTLLSAAAEHFSTNTELDSTTAAAFRSIGYESPFGKLEFQEVWIRRFENRNGEWLTQVMEATIQECYRKKIAIPKEFYPAKHDVEKLEMIEHEKKHGKAAPL
jgi:hypothetical protein